MKKNLKKLQLNRETLIDLERVTGGVKAGAAAGTHHRSLCVDECQPGDTPTQVPD